MTKPKKNSPRLNDPQKDREAMFYDQPLPSRELILNIMMEVKHLLQKKEWKLIMQLKLMLVIILNKRKLKNSPASRIYQYRSAPKIVALFSSRLLRASCKWRTPELVR